MLSNRFSQLIQLLSRFPGVGEKTAQRFALFLISEGGDLADELGKHLINLSQILRPCDLCGNIAEVDEQKKTICAICRDTRRDSHLLCVVARVQDLMAIERSGVMRGRYFVLGRLLSPLDGIGPDELPIEQLTERIEREGVTEVIVATPPSVDGEATALLLARELTALGIRVSRIASGVPHGGDLEFADQITLGRAIDGRRSIDLSR